MRPSQCLETHLKRQSDLAGTRERISTRRSSVSLSAAVSLPLGGEEEDLHTQRWGIRLGDRVKKGEEGRDDSWRCLLCVPDPV